MPEQPIDPKTIKGPEIKDAGVIIMKVSGPFVFRTDNPNVKIVKVA